MNVLKVASAPALKTSFIRNGPWVTPYQSSVRILLHFDRLAAEKFPKEKTITREMCSAWLRLKPGERRVTPIRQLGKYMKGLGYGVYFIPGHIPNKQIKYEAHIYTVAEVKAFFNAIDRCPPSLFSPTRIRINRRRFNTAIVKEVSDIRDENSLFVHGNCNAML